MNIISGNSGLKIELICAVDSKWGISKSGKIPWNIPIDTNYFQDVTKRISRDDDPVTMKNVVIMGRNTWECLPLQSENDPGLKDRINIVVSKTLAEKNPYTHQDLYFVELLGEAIDKCRILRTDLKISKIFICGGSGIYKEALKTLNIHEIHLTLIGKDYQCDNFFPQNLMSDDFCSEVGKLKKPQFGEPISDKNCVQFSILRFSKLKENLLTHNISESKYLLLLESIIKNGEFKNTRNSKVWSLFGKHLEFDLSEGFPILTTKKIFLKGIFEELIFFLKGDTNSNHLNEKGVKIWNPNTSREFLDSVNLSNYESGDMGPMYGFNWVHYGAEYKGMNSDYTGLGFNQIDYCLNLLKSDPFSRRIMMTTYNPVVAKDGCLFPCHGIDVIFNVKSALSGNFELNCMMTQRSADAFLGVPFNIASYALLLHFFCEVINNDDSYKGQKFMPGTLLMNFADIHIYESHYIQAVRQFLRHPYKFPHLKINRTVKSLTDFKYEDLELVGYKCYPGILAKMVA